MWSKTALMFPGQGSQVVGMGRDLAEAYPEARTIFDEADEVLGFKFSELFFNGPEADLNETINTQPAVYSVGVATLAVLQAQLPAAQPAMTAGHSLGEITALVAADALTFADGLKLARERGRLMKEAGDRSPGAMAALLGLDAPAAQELVDRAKAQTNGVLVVANDNCPGQVVISGDSQTLDVALELAEEMKVRRAVKLAISIAAHSPLMQMASDQFNQILAQTSFAEPVIPVYANWNAAPMTSVSEIRDGLGRQLTGPVRWTETMQNMIGAGMERFIELGSQDVLSGLLRRIDRSPERVTLNSAEAMAAFVSASA
jgi:[acyl-carrier-protein] S-malonyltransferase